MKQNYTSQVKRILLHCLLTFVLVCELNAQAPQAFKYQAVIRSSEGMPIVSSPVSIRISIIDDISAIIPVYQEIHEQMTSSGGLISLNIGHGSLTLGSFAEIHWAISEYFIRVEIRTEENAPYTHMGTSQLLSVPYALYSKESGGVPSATWGELNGSAKARQVHHPGKMVYVTDMGQMAYFDGFKWSLIAACPPLDTVYAGEDRIKIIGNQIQLEARKLKERHSGKWSLGKANGFSENGIFSDNTNPSAIFSGLPGHNYQLIWTISTACESNSDTLMASFCHSLTSAQAGPDMISILNDTTVMLNGNTPPDYNQGLWSIISGSGGHFSDPTLSNSGFSGLPGEFYMLTWTINAECNQKSVDTMLVSFCQRLVIANAGSDQFNINSSDTQLDANDPGSCTGQWSIVSGTGGFFDNGGTHSLTSSEPKAVFWGQRGSAYVLSWLITADCNQSSSDVMSLSFCPLMLSAFAGGDIESACNPFSLSGNEPGTGNTGTWEIISGNGGTLASDYISGSQTTLTGTPGEEYALTYKISNVCEFSIDTVIIAFEPLPTIADAGGAMIGAPIIGNQYTLNGNQPAINESGKWTITAGVGGSFLNSIDNIPGATFIGLPNHAYSLRWTITNQCQISSSDSLVLSFCPTMVQANAGSNASRICGSYLLTGNVPGAGNTGVWSKFSGNGGGFDPQYVNCPGVLFTGLPGESYVLVYTISNQCSSSSDTITIMFEPLPGIANAGSSPGVPVTGSSFALNANQPASNETAKWTIVSGVGGSFENNNDTIPSAVFFGLPGNTYVLKWTIANNCNQFTTDSIELHFCPDHQQANAGEDSFNSCLPHILGGSNPGSGTGTWTVVSGSPPYSFCSINNPQAAFTGVRGGIYTLRWTVSDTCNTSWDEVQIGFEQLPTPANAGPDITVVGNTVTLGANTPSNGTGTWSVVSGVSGSYSFSSITDPNAQFTGVYNLSYMLMWEIKNACNEVSTDTLTINFLKPFLCGDSLVDSRDNQIYPTVQIGNQCWMAKNLNVGNISYNNQTNNLVIEKFCYDHEPSNCNEYGGMYLWDEMMGYTSTPGGRGICPIGWHIPTLFDFEQLIAFLGESAGGKLKEEGNAHWNNNFNATNSSGFTAFGGGMRSTFFTALKTDGRFWASNESGTNAYHMRLRNSTDTTSLPTTMKITALSVRCVRD